MGHSMGGLFAVEYLSTRNVDRKFDSAILSSPALGLTKRPYRPKVLYLVYFQIFFGRIFSYMFPNMIIDNGLDPRGISRDAKVVEDYKRDPLHHEKISLYTGRKIFNLQDKFAEEGQFKTDARILLVHGGSDLMTLVDASKDFFHKSLEWDKKHKLICVEGGYHECNKHILKCSA